MFYCAARGDKLGLEAEDSEWETMHTLYLHNNPEALQNGWITASCHATTSLINSYVFLAVIHVFTTTKQLPHTQQSSEQLNSVPIPDTSIQESHPISIFINTK